MLIFILVIIAATVIGGLIGGELTDNTFTIWGATIGSIGTFTVLMSLGAYFDKRETAKEVKLTLEIRGVFDRMLGRKPYSGVLSKSKKSRPKFGKYNLLETVESLIKQDRADLVAGKVLEKRLIPHHAIKRDIAKRAFKVDFEKLTSRMQELNKEDFDTKLNGIRQMDQHQLDALLGIMKRERTDLLEIEQYVRASSSLYATLDPIFEKNSATSSDIPFEGLDGKIHPIQLNEPTEEFSECWLAAGRHLQSQAHDGKINWLKANLQPPFLEHFSFRLGNQLFFVRVEDIDDRFDFPGAFDGYKVIASACKGNACRMPMRRTDGDWGAALSGWSLIDAYTEQLLNPIMMITAEKIEMTDWEVQDFGVQIVRDYIEKKTGREIMSVQGNPNLDPSIWFVGDGGPEWVIVRVVRYPKKNASIPINVDAIRSGCSHLSKIGHFASVALSSSEDNYSTQSTEHSGLLLRGHGMHVHFSGLQDI